jgi:DNA-binding transcriptional LysR family regulator
MRHLTPLRYIDIVAKAGSIRKAAETLAITSTALNRRILALEEELGVPIFERLPRGVRLSTAGELLVHHIRGQISDMEKLRSQIADLMGERRGHVSIACSQALLPYFLPEQIASYRREHPAVTFSVQLRDRAAAEQALVDHSADIALVFEPVRLSDVQVLATVPQVVHAVMGPDHPLAALDRLRLGDCARFPVGFPQAPYGVRTLLDLALVKSSVTLSVALESDSFEFLRRYPAQENLITFQIPIGLPATTGHNEIVSRPLDIRDVPPGRLYLCQLKGRTLPVAAAKFAGQLEKSLAQRFEQGRARPAG